jgi:hypothetical protein
MKVLKFYPGKYSPFRRYLLPAILILLIYAMASGGGYIFPVLNSFFYFVLFVCLVLVVLYIIHRKSYKEKPNLCIDKKKVVFSKPKLTVHLDKKITFEAYTKKRPDGDGGEWTYEKLKILTPEGDTLRDFDAVGFVIDHNRIARMLNDLLSQNEADREAYLESEYQELMHSGDFKEKNSIRFDEGWI